MPYSKKKRVEREQYALIEVTKSFTAHLELPKLLETVMDKIDEFLDPAEFGVLLLWNPSEGVILPQASCGVGIKDPDALYKIRLQEDE